MKKVNNALKNFIEFDSRYKMILGLSFVFIFLLVYHLRINQPSKKSLTIDVRPDVDIQMSNLIINIGYSDSGKDKVHIGFGARKRMKEDTLETAGIHIETDDIIKPSEINSYNSCEYKKNRRKRKNNEWLRIDKSSCGFSQNYKGNIFEKLNSDITTYFYLNFSHNYISKKGFPDTKVVLYDIEQLKVETIYPEPDEYNIYSLTYSSKEKIEQIFREGIRFYGEHKRRKHTNQNKIFLLGLFIGIIFSAIIEIIINLYKDSNSKNTPLKSQSNSDDEI